jgi:polyphenol oxidase
VSPALPLIHPHWPAPAAVGAVMSTRAGGVSESPFDSLNLSFSVGDDPAAVAENRARLAAAVGQPLCFAHLVHGAQAHRVVLEDAGRALPPADALWTTEAGLALVVTAADCLPVLFCDHQGRGVAAAHAGWRGLALGVLEAQALRQGLGGEGVALMAWLGPCIGPQRFEVGAEVLQAFTPAEQACFTPRLGSTPARWWCDLPALAEQRLHRAGVGHISSVHVEGACTASDASRFFSFRRDRSTGRMAAAIWLQR